MFQILKKSSSTGVATTAYPKAAAAVSENFRGAPEFDFPAWTDARPASRACPTGAIALAEQDGVREVAIDLGRCIFCAECAMASADGAVRVSREFELAAADRRELVVTARYELNADGTHGRLLGVARHAAEDAGQRAAEAIHRTLGRSLAIRQVDAGSCNGCELEIGALNNPVFDIERFGVHFVASPRHADALLVTGPVARNMELAVRKTWAATPDPKIVIAVGTCGVSGGLFGVNYASCGAVDRVIPVDIYIPGCPPRPQALIHAILMAVGRLARKRTATTAGR